MKDKLYSFRKLEIFGAFRINFGNNLLHDLTVQTNAWFNISDIQLIEEDTHGRKDL